MSLLLGLGAAVGYGTGDFLGGLASRRGGVLPVLVTGQVVGFAVLVVAIPATPLGVPLTEGFGPLAADLGWGGVAGIAKAAAGLMLLRGFRAGAVGVVSPVSSLTGAGVPVLAGIALGERPTALALAGIAIALVAIGLVSAGGSLRTPRPEALATGFGYGLGAGLGFASIYLSLDQTSAASGIWPVLVAQTVVVAILVPVALARRRRLIPVREAWLPTAGLGLTTAAATVSFLLGTRAGLVSLTAVLASMSPAVTVMLAWTVMKEELPRGRIVGLLAAGVALTLIGFG